MARNIIKFEDLQDRDVAAAERIMLARDFMQQYYEYTERAEEAKQAAQSLYRTVMDENDYDTIEVADGAFVRKQMNSTRRDLDKIKLGLLTRGVPADTINAAFEDGTERKEGNLSYQFTRARKPKDETDE